MGKIGIVTDSHSGISKEEAKEREIYVLPMPFFMDEKCYYESVSLKREDFFKYLAGNGKVSTSQPVPEEVETLWREVLESHDEIVYIPISSSLSGSCNTAMMLAETDEFKNKVYVVDNGRVSVPMYRSVLDAVELKEEGYSAAQIKDILEKSKEKMCIYIAVDTLEYLKRGGRINAATASIGSVLNIKPILKLGTGPLDAYKKCRGMKKARKEMILAVKNDLETFYKKEWDNGEVCLMAATSTAEEMTREWVSEIEAAFPGMKVSEAPLPLGICCHIGEGGLGIAYSCRPERNK